MTEPLVVCSGCARHVRLAETSCPFCAATLTPSEGDAHSGASLRGLSRSALLFAGALALSACESSTAAVYGGPPVSDNSSGATGTDNGNNPAAADAATAEPDAESHPTVVAIYGAPSPR